MQAAAERAPLPSEPLACPVCNGQGVVWLEPQASAISGSIKYDVARPCDCRATAEREGWIAASGIPPHFRGKDFVSYRAQPHADLRAAELVEDWALHGQGSLLLFGDVRKGKTGLACAAGVVRMRNGLQATFLKSPDLLGEMRNSFDHANGGPRPSELLAAVREVPLLVLDDLGVEQIPTNASWLDQLFYQVIDHRHDYERPMLITTNLGGSGTEHDGEPFEALSTRMQARTVYRLMEMVGPRVIRVGGEHQRRRGR